MPFQMVASAAMSGLRKRLYPNGPMIAAGQLLSGEVPLAAIHTRYIVVIAADDVLDQYIGNTGNLFAAIEHLETGGWEVVSIARDQVLIYAYMRQVTSPGGHPASGPGHAAG